MKNILRFWPVMLIASLALSACQEKELDNPNDAPLQGERFIIRLTPPTKTANNGLGTEWVSGDMVNVFHAEAGSTDYINDGAFEYVGSGDFAGDLSEELDGGKAYDWYVSYPYNANMHSPENMPISIPASQTQASDGSMAHLCGSLCPLAGKEKGVSGANIPTVNMGHLVTVMKIKVTNYEAEVCNLERVAFCHHTGNTPDEGVRTILGGDYLVDITGDDASYTLNGDINLDLGIGGWEENDALTRAGGTADFSRFSITLEQPKALGLNESATVYLACIPFTIENGTRLCIGMNMTEGGISQSIYGKSPVCKAGVINGIKQGSRLAPPFKSNVNFYHGKKNSDGTYTIDNDGWWRCDLPEGFDLQGSFNFKDLFTTVNVDNKFEFIDAGNQNRTVQSMFDQFKACLNENENTGDWNGNENLEVNLYFPDDDRSGIFINATAGYNVGAWPILFREPYSGDADEPVIDTESEMYDSYQGLVMAGYQGWHGTPGDGCSHNPIEGWPHYASVAQSPFIFEPGVLRSNIDFWPDVSEYPQTYNAPEGFELPDGSTPRLYSSYDESTVDLHFSWMKEYGIDGVFMQRFVSQLTDARALDHSDKVLQSAMTASNVHARAISIMYDMVGMDSSTSADVILNDAAALISKYNLMDRSQGQRYFLYHNGKPLIGLVSVGQETAAYTVAQAQAIVDGLQALGFSIILGVPAYWRSPGEGDCVNDSAITTLIKDVDIIMPWLVGVYDYDGTVEGTTEGKFTDYFDERMEDSDGFFGIGATTGDFTQAEDYGVEYCPLVFPGFSDRNMHPNNQVFERYSGDFYWQQIYKFINKGAKMLYVAMFDEIDEGTAIYKCLRKSEVPSNTYSSDYYVVYENGAYRRSDTEVSVSGSSDWCKKASELNVTYNGIEDGLDSDYYLWLTGEAGKMLRGETSVTETKPTR